MLNVVKTSVGSWYVTATWQIGDTRHKVRVNQDNRAYEGQHMRAVEALLDGLESNYRVVGSGYSSGSMVNAVHVVEYVS